MRKIFKYEALGNDYIVIDPRNFDILMSEKNIIKICNRNFGCGSDGILYGPIFKGNDIFLKIFLNIIFYCHITGYIFSAPAP